MLDCWLQVSRIKITFTLLLTNCFVSTTTNSCYIFFNEMPCKLGSSCDPHSFEKPHLNTAWRCRFGWGSAFVRERFLRTKKMNSCQMYGNVSKETYASFLPYTWHIFVSFYAQPHPKTTWRWKKNSASFDDFNINHVYVLLYMHIIINLYQQAQVDRLRQKEIGVYVGEDEELIFVVVVLLC